MVHPLLCSIFVESYLQFIDLCILLGCDYLEPIRGIGPKSALKLIKEHGGLEGVVKHLRVKWVSPAQLVFLLAGV